MPWLRVQVIALLLFFSLVPIRAQQHAPIQNSTQGSERSDLEAEMSRKAQAEQEKKRFETMKRDSQKLLDLATELKNYVDKSGEDILSLEVVRKAEEMERLARQVKNAMRGN